jgi:hypothetical protein
VRSASTLAGNPCSSEIWDRVATVYECSLGRLIQTSVDFACMKWKKQACAVS